MCYFLNLSPKATHQWAVPIAHAMLWIIGLTLTFKGFEWEDKSWTQLYGLVCVFSVFVTEIAITYLDLLTQREKYSSDALPVALTVFSIALFVTALTLLVLLNFVHESYNKYSVNTIWLWLFMFLTTSLKLLEVWLPNNIDARTKDKQKGPVVSHVSINLNN